MSKSKVKMTFIAIFIRIILLCVLFNVISRHGNHLWYDGFYKERETINKQLFYITQHWTINIINYILFSELCLVMSERIEKFFFL